MNSRKQSHLNYRAYSRKKSNLEARLENEFLDHGVATIPCRVESMEDILSPYSVRNCESLNGDFVSYVSSITDLVPESYPVVLSIVGKAFTPEEREILEGTIKDDFAYALGAVEKENRHQRNIFLGVTAGVVITSVLMQIFDGWGVLPTEWLFVLFWFFAEIFVDYVFLGGRQLRKQRIKAARLACLQVVFSGEYDERDDTDKEAAEVLKGVSDNIAR